MYLNMLIETKPSISSSNFILGPDFLRYGVKLTTTFLTSIAGKANKFKIELYSPNIMADNFLQTFFCELDNETRVLSYEVIEYKEHS